MRDYDIGQARLGQQESLATELAGRPATQRPVVCLLAGKPAGWLAGCCSSGGNQTRPIWR